MIKIIILQLFCFFFFGLLPGTGSERQGENKNVEEKRKQGDEKSTVNMEINFSSYSPELKFSEL